MLINLITFILDFAPEILIIAPIAIFAFLELRTERRWVMVMGWVVGIGAVVAGVLLAAGYPLAPHHAWSNGRLAPAISWVRGFDLYTYPGAGPMLVQMYGPMSAMVYTPAALAGEPTAAVLIGVAINSLMYIIPAGIFLLAARRGQHALFATAGLVGLVLLSTRQFMLKEAATLVTIDAPALGFAAIAMAILARGLSGDMLRTGLICGFFAALSIWTKLTLAPIVFAMAIYVLLGHGLRGAIRFTIGMAISGLLVSGILILCFGLPMLFQNIVVPSKQPWQWPQLSPRRAYGRALTWMWRHARPVGWVAILGILLSIRLPYREPGSWRRWVGSNPWLLPLLMGLAVIPTAGLAYVKLGGSWNNAVAPTYLILLAAVAGLSGACGVPSDTLLPASKRAGRVCLALLVVIGCWMGPERVNAIAGSLRSWGDLSQNENQQAFHYAREHPGQAYFPTAPLATLLAENRLYHFDAGLTDLTIAGFVLTDEQLRAHLPEDLRAVLYRSDTMIPSVTARLAEFDKPALHPSMPAWIILTRDGSPP